MKALAYVIASDMLSVEVFQENLQIGSQKQSCCQQLFNIGKGHGRKCIGRLWHVNIFHLPKTASEVEVSIWHQLNQTGLNSPKSVGNISWSWKDT